MSFIAQNALTYSKTTFPDGTPKGVGGLGHLIVTTDGLLTDYVCGLGCNLLDVENSLSLPTQREESLAFKLTEIFPCIDKVKILKSGADGCEAAVRIARAYHQNKKSGGGDVFYDMEGRIEINGCGTGYHGWDNTFISSESPGTGTVDSGYFKRDNFDELIKTLNAVDEYDSMAFCIIEPVELDLNVKEQLTQIRSICSEKDIVLIFDETITALRFPNYCVSNYFNIQPDLIIFGKGLGNGYPISVVGGSRDIMESEGYFISGTFFGELSAIDSALHVLDYLDESKISDLWRRGQEIMENFNEISDKIQMRGYPTRCVWDGDETFVATFCQQMQRKGFLLHPKVWFISDAHTSTINAEFVDKSRQCINDIIRNNIQLKGAVPQPVFKRNG